MLLQSNSGIPVRVSSRFVPLTSHLKQTLNILAGKEIYPISPKSHGEITWTPEIKVTVPVKSRRLIFVEPSEQSSARKSSIWMTDKQADYRLARNCSWKIIRKGKRVPEDAVAKVDGNWKEVISMASEVVSSEYVRHDSHGRHGRKPRYKDISGMRTK